MSQFLTLGKEGGAVLLVPLPPCASSLLGPSLEGGRMGIWHRNAHQLGANHIPHVNSFFLSSPSVRWHRDEGQEALSVFELYHEGVEWTRGRIEL